MPGDEDKWFFVMFAKVFKFPFASSSEHAERQKEREGLVGISAHTPPLLIRGLGKRAREWQPTEKTIESSAPRLELLKTLFFIVSCGQYGCKKTWILSCYCCMKIQSVPLKQIFAKHILKKKNHNALKFQPFWND